MTDRRIALLVLCTGALMMILDETIVNVALPVIQDDLRFAQQDLAWVVNAYLIAFGGLLLLAGRLGDLLGRRRVFLAGLALFTAASIACGAAQTPAMLVAARFLQGAGGAMASAVILGMIVTLFPEPRARAKAIGVFSFTQASGGSIGLLAGGVVTDTAGWHWIFFVNVPIALAVAAGALRFVPAGLAAATRTGARVPLIPRRLLRNRAVWIANGIQAVAIAGLFGIQFLGGQYLQHELGYTPLQQGLAFLPLVVGIAVFSLLVSGKAINRFGAATVMLPGLALIAAGLGYLARGPLDGHYVADVLPSMVALGIGGGLAIPALMNLVMSAATEQDAGAASGLATTTQQVGGAAGLTLVAALAARHGVHLGFAVGAALVLAALVLAAVMLRDQISRSSWRVPRRAPARSSRTSPSGHPTGCR
jgi:MFS family permease